MNVLFDNCTSPVLAKTLDGYISSYGHRSFHLCHNHQLSVDRNATDEAWINAIGQDERVWFIVTGDDRIRKNQILRAALRGANIRGFVLAPAYQKTTLNVTASVLVRKWPDMEQQIKLAQGAALFELSINYRTGFKTLPFCLRCPTYPSRTTIISQHPMPHTISSPPKP